MTDHASVAAEVARLQTLTTDQLRQEYRRYVGEEPRSRNRQWLFRRTAWAYQASIYGGLSEGAKQRLAELAPTAELALRTPRDFDPTRVIKVSRPVRDPRLPRRGTILMKYYRGRRIIVEVLKNGFSYEGQVFKSLSAVAFAVTETRWNGWLFFNLGKRNIKK